MRTTTSRLYVKMQHVRSILRGLAANTSGQDLVEYALVVALLAFAAAAGMASVASQINAEFISIGAKVSAYTT
jgi:pilus assembly protein Flp/PilA